MDEELEEQINKLVPSQIMEEIFENSIKMAKKCPDLVADFRVAIEKEQQKIILEGDGY